MKYTRMEGIRPRREALGISIQEAAARLQVTRQAWYVWETADVMPASGLLPDLAAVLGCRIEELYEKPQGDTDGGPMRAEGESAQSAERSWSGPSAPTRAAEDTPSGAARQLPQRGSQ